MDLYAELRRQWRNPGDILSLLLIIAEMWYNVPSLAFSFGWVGYAFASLDSVIGDKQLMPSEADTASLLINCSTGYRRIHRSRLLGRILRDYELAVEEDPGSEYADLADTGKRISFRIGIFTVEGLQQPQIDRVWTLGWLIIALQLGISIVPWIWYGDWMIFLVTASGTALALFTGSLRWWGMEKWAGRRLDQTGSNGKTKIVCLTRGNDHTHAMVLLGKGTAWDLETLATATSPSLTETPWVLGGLAVLWACLLLTVSGIKSNRWFLVVIGSMGMIQNLYASAAKRPSSALGVRSIPYAKRPSIVGLSFDWPFDDEKSDENMDDTTMQWREPLGYRMIPGVRGAIRESKKLFPKAGVALMREFSPALVKYEPKRYRTNAEKKFWKKAFREFAMPVVK